MHIQLVGLIDASEHHLGLVRVHQRRPTSGLFDLIGDPVPAPRRLHRYRRTGFRIRQVRPNRPPFMLDPLLPGRPGAHRLPLPK